MLLTSKTGKRRAVLGTLAVTLVVAIISPGVWAQNDDNNTDDTGGDTTIIAGNLPGAGVVVDALGVVSMKRIDGTGELSRRRRLEAKSKLDANVAKASDSRKISLNRLADAVRQSVDANQPITDELKFLAGLTKIQHVFYYPETKDIVIAGPAEGFMLDDMDRPVGIFSGEPTLLLEDLVVALRTFGPGVKRVGSVGCSIDPTQDGLQRMQDFLQELSRRNLRPSDAEFIADGLQKSLGLQEVTITGIPANTHFANILVEADYRMKLIGIGLEVPPVRLKSYVERANAASLQRNGLQRWYFVPDYETVCISDDGLAAEIRGHGVKLVGANELVRADGTRMETNRVDQASERFCQDFTKQYPNLAAKAPVYGQLRNLIDMLIVAALIQNEDYYAEAGWDLGVLADEGKFPVEVYAAPKQVDTAVNIVWKGSRLTTPVGGGVHIDARQAVSSANLIPDQDGTVAARRQEVSLQGLAQGQWWWD